MKVLVEYLTDSYINASKAEIVGNAHADLKNVFANLSCKSEVKVITRNIETHKILIR